MKITHLFIDAALADSPQAMSIQSKLGAPVTYIKNQQQVYDHVNQAEDPISRGKQVLWLTRNKGAFIKSCPGTKAYTCCGYKILHVGSFCDMDCSYCILQAYFHPAVMQWFVNYEKLFQELDQLFTAPGISRIGTGEFTDSLIWEPWVDLNVQLIKRFATQNRAVLELKTKTTAVRALKALDHNRKTILAWSLNTPRVIRENERRTASLEQRLSAARQCANKDYPLAFHFDPMVIYEDCYKEYQQVIEQLFAKIDADSVVWISLGTFRFIPSLKPIIEKRFPQTKLPYGEFVTGQDGKMRYFKSLRIALFHHVAASIRACAPNTLVYLCMEDQEVWEKALGYYPEQGEQGLIHLLDQAARRHCGLRAKSTQ